ncbi:class I adenylate-forming enzyme family protein [Sphingomonas jatrophae]|uniref:Acyl-CoA synthetase (AMP-forming)/AMP-acid ligase II n=1 Tax=Sphingomonas jatrophae TaxID=1166337 RepID=A0A1I6KGL5_9SPHN|nr:class I adenylate-forming enzyme family protein [Sphingomonas jatrophae]SFR90392.1 Acyl-CoA synthetase (AMP-forming)/AMP-acid ligase II [Sphingomonas jatrophae]
MDVIDRVAETLRTKADGPAIEYAGAWTSWGEVAAYGDQVGALLDAAGCAPDARIGVIIRNRAAHAAAVIGLLAHRRAVSFLYPFLPEAELAKQIEALGAAAIVADMADWPKLRAAVEANGGAGIALGADVRTPPQFVEGLERTRRAPVGEDHGGVEVLSSGTTGPPKRIAMPLAILERAVLSAPGGEAGSVPPVQINVWPLGGVGGMCLLTAAAATGTPLVLFDRFSVEELVEAIRRHRPPTIGLPPTAISMILDANVPPEDMASIKSVSGGSAYLDPDVQERFEQRYGATILWGMGATEFCGTIVRWTPEMRERAGSAKRGSTGKAMPGVELRTVDPDTGEIQPPGKDGLLEVHCPAVRPDWVRTTDLVMIDDDGFVFHRGRADGAIVRGGFKVLPERVVDALRAHPAVADASVIGIDDARLGAVPVAAVELVPGPPQTDEAALMDYLRERLPAMQVPTELRIVDALPRTPSLKVSLTDVRKLFERVAA